MARPAIFLDRDGVLNRALVVAGKPYAPRALADFRLLPGVKAAVARLRASGFEVVVVTNQPDIGNGLVEAEVVAAMHDRLRVATGIQHIYCCPHRQDENCACRKPRPGMLLAAAQELGLDLASSWMVGDRQGDVVAGKAAGCRTVFIDRGYFGDRRYDTAADLTATTLPGAVAMICNERSRSQ
jgi:D-glycero-D-manno-heptose 1,7-bisphosphate phosphatase